MSSRILAILVVALSLGGVVSAAEIQLRALVRPAGNVVCLRDVAEITGLSSRDGAALGAVELCTAPSAGTTRVLRSREIQDLLAQQGVDLAQVRFAGAGQVQIAARDANVTAATASSPRAKAGDPRRAAEQLRDAIVQYLRQQTGSDEEFRVQVRLTPTQAGQLRDAAGGEISGGREPFLGSQQFTWQGVRDGAPLRMTIDATVSAPTMIVVAARPLAKGDLVRAADLTLERTKHPVQHATFTDRHFRAVEEVVGQEVQRTISPGQPIEASLVRKPLLVQRGEVVTVVAYAQGIRVKTSARARQAGSQGDLIEVESLDDRSRYFAKVSDMQQVEVYARAMQTDRPTAGR